MRLRQIIAISQDSWLHGQFHSDEIRAFWYRDSENTVMVSKCVIMLFHCCDKHQSIIIWGGRNCWFWSMVSGASAHTSRLCLFWALGEAKHNRRRSMWYRLLQSWWTQSRDGEYPPKTHPQQPMAFDQAPLPNWRVLWVCRAPKTKTTMSQ